MKGVLLLFFSLLFLRDSLPRLTIALSQCSPQNNDTACV